MPHLPSADTTIGDRVAAIRRQRTLTQEQLAEAAGVSVETIRKLEQNDRTSARISTLNRLARALAVRTSQLFGTSGQPMARSEDDADGVALTPLRRVLTPARGLTGAIVAGPEADAPTMAEVSDSIWSIDRAYHDDDLAGTLASLPMLLVEAQTLVQTADEGQRQAAVRLLSQANQLAGEVLIQIRQFDLAHQALDVAANAARSAGDELVGATTVVSLCWLLLREGRFEECEQLAVTTADAIEPSLRRGTPEQLATWGWLMLRGAAAASRDNRDGTATVLLDAATAAAARNQEVGVRSPGPATVGVFCPTTVAMKRVEAAVVAGDTARAMALAAQVPPTGRPTSNNRNRHLLDVAFAQTDLRRYAEAQATLSTVLANAPVWLRHQRFARDVVSSLVTSRRRALDGELARLVEAVGLEL